MEIYIFYHCPCIYESAAYPVSLHRTKKGAYKAMNAWLNEQYNEEYDKYLMFYGKRKNYKRNTFYTFKVGAHESWFVKSKIVME